MYVTRSNDSPGLPTKDGKSNRARKQLAKNYLVYSAILTYGCLLNLWNTRSLRGHQYQPDEY